MAVKVRLYPTNASPPPQPPAAAVATQPYGAADDWSVPLKSRLVEVALAAAAIVSPVFDPTSAPSAAVAFFDQTKSKTAEVATLDQAVFTPQGAIFSITPQGYEAQVPLLFARKFPSGLQQVTSFPEQGSITTVRYGASDVWPERFAKPFKAALQKYEDSNPTQGNVPTQFVNNAWVAAWDGPARKCFPAPLQQFDLPVLAAYAAVVVTYPDGWQVIQPERYAKRLPVGLQPFTPDQRLFAIPFPEGWPAIYPERFAKPFPVKLQMVQPDTWIGNVPTAFVGNAWVAFWDGPSRARYPAKLQQFEHAPQAAYATVVVTFPDGWQVEAPARSKAPGRGWWLSASDTPIPAASQPLGAPWGAEPAFRQKPRFQGGEVITVLVPARSDGWVVEFGQPQRKARSVTGDAVLPLPTVARATLVGDLWPEGRRRKLGRADEVITPPQSPAVVAAPGNTDLWSSIGYRFRVIRPPPPDFARPLRAPPPMIASQPNLIGVSANPTLLGVSTKPTLMGISTSPTLLAVSTAPTLLGVSTNPTLRGKV